MLLVFLVLLENDLSSRSLLDSLELHVFLFFGYGVLHPSNLVNFLLPLVGKLRLFSFLSLLQLSVTLILGSLDFLLELVSLALLLLDLFLGILQNDSIHILLALFQLDLVLLPFLDLLM